MIDATPEFVKISEAKQHDKKFLKDLHIAPHSMIVFDRAYNHYFQFAEWTKQQVNFVCRLKKNAKYNVVEELFKRHLTEDESGVFLEEHIHLIYKKDEQNNSLCLRKVAYKDERGRKYNFITNNFEITGQQVTNYPNDYSAVL